MGTWLDVGTKVFAGIMGVCVVGTAYEMVKGELMERRHRAWIRRCEAERARR